MINFPTDAKVSDSPRLLRFLHLKSSYGLSKGDAFLALHWGNPNIYVQPQEANGRQGGCKGRRMSLTWVDVCLFRNP